MENDKELTEASAGAKKDMEKDNSVLKDIESLLKKKQSVSPELIKQLKGIGQVGRTSALRNKAAGILLKVQSKDEDAPANSIAGGGVDIQPQTMDFKGLKRYNDLEKKKRKKLANFMK